MAKLNVIDLFSGAGGLSEGFLQTNKYNFISHVEWEMPMVRTLRNNLVKRWGYSEDHAKSAVINFDIQKTKELMMGNWDEETIEKYGNNNSAEIQKFGIDGQLNNRSVDVIVGGPPCQAYSLAGRAQDPNSMKDDYRNYLFESFVNVVAHYKPKVFVFENVPGMLSAKPGDEFVINRIFYAFQNIGYEIRTPNKMKASIYSAASFGVPQERRRVIIFGVRSDTKLDVESFYNALNNLMIDGNRKTVRDAIYGLPSIYPLDKPYKKGNRNVSHQSNNNDCITLHEPRYHNPRDIKIFERWLEDDMNYISNNEKLKFYEKVTGHKTNHNKYRNLEWDKPSPTIVSHLYKDGLMFIHPDKKQLRSITVREAALLQSFPIDYEFIGSNAYCYKMIGNAVPVLFAKKIAEAVFNVLEEQLCEN